MRLLATMMRFFGTLNKDQKRLLLLEGLVLIICIPFITDEVLSGRLTVGGAITFIGQTILFVFLFDFCFFTIFPYLWMISFPRRSGMSPELTSKGSSIKQKRRIFLMLTGISSVISFVLYLADMKLEASLGVVVALVFLAHTV